MHVLQLTRQRNLQTCRKSKISRKFEFTIGDEIKTVEAGDTMLQMDDIIHGCTCLEKGIILDFFTPMREDFI